MEKFGTIDEILDFAMEAEQEAVDFYTQLASQMQNMEMKETFIQFAKEEVGHKARLQKIKDERLFDLADEKVPDLKIADYIVNVKPDAQMSYADALVLAMKKEKAAFKLYTTLAQRTDNARKSTRLNSSHH